MSDSTNSLMAEVTWHRRAWRLGLAASGRSKEHLVERHGLLHVAVMRIALGAMICTT